MTDLLLAARPVTPTEMRAVPVNKEAVQTALHDPSGDMPPVQAPDELERSGLQPLPFPERRPLVVFSTEEDGAAHHLALRVSHGEAMSAFTISQPSRVDPMSLFQGLLAQAAQTGVKAGTTARLYVLVQQISSVMNGAQQSTVN